MSLSNLATQLTFQDLEENDLPFHWEYIFSESTFDFNEPDINNKESIFEGLNKLPKHTPKVASHDLKTNTRKEEIKQVWNGTVLLVNDSCIEARLQDKTNPSNPDEIAIIPLDEFDESDRRMLEEGALFYWHIGYEDSLKFARRRFSKIRIRRLPLWTHDEIEKAKRVATDEAQFFNSNT
tara:strand:- start:383713 stop:384252 length:540 start_codon:yes stop_codon:yes gene_type:complete